MAYRYFFISDEEWFDGTSLKNPICATDPALKQVFPQFYSLHYDVRLLVAKAPSKEESTSLFYNDYRERYGSTSISSFDQALDGKQAKYVFLNGFNQEHFLYIAPKIKDSAEVLYLFKCPQIKDLSILAQFNKLRCVHIFWNNSLESLWDMTENKNLTVISYEAITKLKSIETLKDSCVEYIRLDSSDNCGNRKPMLFDATVLDQMQHLKRLILVYKDHCIDR